KLKCERRDTLRARRSNYLEAVDLHELTLERRRDIVGDGVGTRARITDRNLNDGIIDRRKIVDWQLPVGETAEENHRQGEHGGHDGTSNEWLGEIHCFNWPTQSHSNRV